VVLFQPHRYTRTRDLMKEFSVAFHQADSLIVTDIYPAGEERIEGIHGECLVEKIQAEGHPNVAYQPKTQKLAQQVGAVLKPGDILLTLGAGDIGRVGREVHDIL